MLCFNKNCGCKCGSLGCTTSRVGYWLVIVGAVNWGIVGLGGFLGMNLNFVDLIFGFSSTLVHLVYLLVGISGVMLVVGCPCKTCKAGICEGCVPKDKEVPASPTTPNQG